MAFRARRTRRESPRGGGRGGLRLPLEIQIHPTDTFYRCVAGLRDDPGIDGKLRAEVEAALASAIRSLGGYPWPSDLPIHKRDTAANEYEYRFHSSYRFTFRWRGDYRRSRLVRVHLYLKAILKES